MGKLDVSRLGDSIQGKSIGQSADRRRFDPSEKVKRQRVGGERAEEISLDQRKVVKRDRARCEQSEWKDEKRRDEEVLAVGKRIGVGPEDIGLKIFGDLVKNCVVIPRQNVAIQRRIAQSLEGSLGVKPKRISHGQRENTIERRRREMKKERVSFWIIRQNSGPSPPAPTNPLIPINLPTAHRGLTIIKVCAIVEN